MATSPTPPPLVNNLPDAPNSATDSPTVFDQKANAFVAAQVTQVASYNGLADWVESTAQEVYDNAGEAATSATDAAASATESANSATLSASSSNIVGSWSDFSGAASPPASYAHNNAIWALLVPLLDISASEPAVDNTDWQVVGGAATKAILRTDGQELLTFGLNDLQSTQSNQLPLAGSVPAGSTVRLQVSETYKGITTTHLCQGSDTATGFGESSDRFIFSWPTGGEVTLITDGVSNWRY